MDKKWAKACLGGLMMVMVAGPLAAQETGNVMFDWNGVIGTGQSLSVGATPIVSDEQPYGNLRLSRGPANRPPFNPEDSSLEMVPLVELSTATGYPGPYPGNLYGETPHTAMANQVSALARAQGRPDHVSVHTVAGESGQGMMVIRKGARDNGSTGRAYAASLFEVAAINRLARAAGKTYGVQAVLLTHGETDCTNGMYGKEMLRLWTNYNKDIQAITGQTRDLTMLVCQQHSCPAKTGVSASTLAQWKAGLDYPGKIVCIGPNYQLHYNSDNVHLVPEAYRQLGEKYGQVYYERVVAGKDWQPLQPERVVLEGRKIRVDFHVPVGPLVWDTVMEPPYQTGFVEWKAGKGFEVSLDGNRVVIESVEIAGDSVLIACDRDLPASGKGLKVGYAVTGDGTNRHNGTCRWGLLRDSDPFVGLSGQNLPNYSVAFQVELPFGSK